MSHNARERGAPLRMSTRDRIVEAAGDCFTHYGVGKTTVDDVASAAGTSRATVYRYFAGGRDEVILAVFLRDLRRFLDELTVKLRGERSVAVAIVDGIMDAVAFVTAEPRFAALVAPDAAGHTNAAVTRAADQVLGLCTDYVRPYFDSAQCDGHLRGDIDADGAVEFLFRIIASLVTAPRKRSDDETRRFLRTYVVPGLVSS